MARLRAVALLAVLALAGSAAAAARDQVKKRDVTYPTVADALTAEGYTTLMSAIEVSELLVVPPLKRRRRPRRRQPPAPAPCPLLRPDPRNDPTFRPFLPALQLAGLTDVFGPDFQGTLFAPSDAAFQSLIADLTSLGLASSLEDPTIFAEVLVRGWGHLLCQPWAMACLLACLMLVTTLPAVCSLICLNHTVFTALC